tara:strand:+ start:78 stop:473 length:396 start_codon:yes stop_codon:yes gene_type:complete
MTIPPNCDDRETIATYQLAEQWIYPRNVHMGSLISFKDYKCYEWETIGIHPGKVSITPLYHDSGVPLYDIFEDEWEELVGFEFSVFYIVTHTCRYKGREAWECRENYHEYWNGYSIALTIEDQFVYASLKF